jgi:adenylate cyclase
MAQAHAIVDLDIDPIAERTERRRRVLRTGVPILGVALTIAIILTISVYANRANTAGALALSDKILAALDGQINEQVITYFAPARRAALLARNLIEEDTGERQRLFERFAISALREIPQIDNLSLADGDGNFLMVTRNETTGGLDTKSIRNEPGRRAVSWVRRDREGRQTAREEDPDDRYDPRTRPWFTGALSIDGVFWTEVYTFYTTGEAGITAGIRLPGGDSVPAVIGIDITVRELSDFLGRLAIGTNGRAMIVEGKGRIVAHSRLNKERLHGTGAGPARIDEIGDDAAVAAYDHFRVDGPGRRRIESDGNRYLSIAIPVNAAGHDWSILIVGPEDDFIGFVGRTNQIGLLMSLAIIVLAAAGAGLLARQGLRADRAVRLALHESQIVGRQMEIFQRLADDPRMFDPTKPGPPLSLTESAAEIGQARTAGLCYLLADETLRCTDLFRRRESVHITSTDIRRGEVPRFFDSLFAGVEIDIADAERDPRTAELYRLILAPFGARSLSMFPIRREDCLLGALWVEDPEALATARPSLRVIASLAGFYAEAAQPEAAKPAMAASGYAGQEHYASRGISADLAAHPLDARVLENGSYGQVSVLVFCLDSAAMAARPKSADLMNSVVSAVQQVATEHEIPYLKIVGGEIVAAAGFAATDTRAAQRIANTAVAGRDRIARLLEVNEIAPEFRLGIDCGVARGREVGVAPMLFNLWGEAVETAKRMALSALPGAIQVSEAAHLQLRDRFLLRPRGSFFLPNSGTAQTFTLAGRL